MRVEISIAKEKAGKMPKGSMEALKDEMTRRLSKQYDDVEVIVKTASIDGLSVLWATDKEIAKEFVETTLKDAWETADDWLYVDRSVQSLAMPLRSKGISPTR